jgi:uncharacterized protein with beta-barrel porin domain
MAVVTAGFLLTAAPVQGADYLVTNANDSGLGSLRQAILDANAAGAGNHTITIDASVTSLTLGATPLDRIGVNVTIDGGGATINGNNNRIFFVAEGNVAFRNLSLSGGLAQGGNGGNTQLGGGGGGGLGAGGAIFIDSGAAVTVENVAFSANQAAGGAGGSVSGFGASAGGGGGGGLHGNGASGGYDGGGGGGGFGGDGGNADGTPSGRAGGGGGGWTADGGNSVGNVAGVGGTPGGNGGIINQPGQPGADGGGGGGGGGSNTGGTGGDFGGGGGGGYSGDGGSGGFGGGSGGTGFVGDEGTPGFGGGVGGATYTGGGGGSAFGGAIFVRSGGSLTVIDSSLSGGVTTAGVGGSGNVYVGANGNAAGTGAYVMAGTTLNFSVSSNGAITVDDTIAGAGGLEKLGAGDLTLTGANTYTGATTVTAGRLAVNNTLTSDVTVAAAGTLGGSGTITGDILNGGLVAPGNSIGTLNLTGNYTQAANSTLQVEIDDAGHTDLLAVTGNVDLDGYVDVKSAPGNYSVGASYTFLTFTGSRTGAFLDIFDDLPFFDAVLVYNSHDVSFYLQSTGATFGGVATTLNQHAVAGVFDAGPAGLQYLADQMQLMNTSQVRDSLDQLGGAVYGTSVQAQFQNTTNQTQMLAGHLSDVAGAASGGGADIVPVSYEAESGRFVFCCRGDGRPSSSTWANSYGLGGSASGDGNAAGFDYGMGGILVGLDHWLDDDSLAGVYGGYNFAKIDGDTFANRVEAGSGQFGSYYRRNFDDRHLLLAGGFGFDAYDSARSINIGGVNSTAAGDYDGWQAVQYAEYGRTLTARAGRRLQPYAGLQYAYLRQNGFYGNRRGRGEPHRRRHRRTLAAQPRRTATRSRPRAPRRASAGAASSRRLAARVPRDRRHGE